MSTTTKRKTRFWVVGYKTSQGREIWFLAQAAHQSAARARAEKRADYGQHVNTVEITEQEFNQGRNLKRWTSSNTSSASRRAC